MIFFMGGGGGGGGTKPEFQKKIALLTKIGKKLLNSFLIFNLFNEYFVY